MRRLTLEEFKNKAQAIHGNIYDYSNVVYVNSHTPVAILCNKCKTIFNQSPNVHLSGEGCPHCNSSIKYTNETFINKAREIHGNKYDYSKVDYINNNTKICIICPEHGEFWQTPANHLHGQGCPKCGKRNAVEKVSYTFDEIIKKARDVHGDKYDYSKYNYINVSTKGTIICKECGKEFEQAMNSHVNQKEGCPYCAKQRLFKSRVLTTESFIEKANEIHKNKYDYTKTNYVNYDTEVEIICPIHGSFFQTPDSHLQGKGCQKCAVHLSNNEDELANFLKNLGVEVERQNRKIISPYEIDIYLPEYKIGIEYNGLLWHSNKYKEDKNYHLKKTELSKKNGVKLIQIFEDEYINHKDIVLSKLMHILGKNEDKDKIYGRKCILNEINYDEALNFLEENHIQGSCSSTIYLGALYENKLVGVMSFKKGKDNTWELTRFATLKDKICIGIGGKLFSYFIKQYNPLEVKSFADRRWTINEENNIYKQLGFKFIEYTRPDYRYYKYNGKMERLHKFNFRKQVLHKKYGLPLIMSENEMTKKMNYLRIYDCGLIKYVWKKED